jgi:hypothetical protein
VVSLSGAHLRGNQKLDFDRPVRLESLGSPHGSNGRLLIAPELNAAFGSSNLAAIRSFGHRAIEERRTKNEERRTKNEERRTKNEERRTNQ